MWFATNGLMNAQLKLAWSRYSYILQLLLSYYKVLLTRKPSFKVIGEMLCGNTSCAVLFLEPCPNGTYRASIPFTQDVRFLSVCQQAKALPDYKIMYGQLNFFRHHPGKGFGNIVRQIATKLPCSRQGCYGWKMSVATASHVGWSACLGWSPPGPLKHKTQRVSRDKSLFVTKRMEQTFISTMFVC